MPIAYAENKTILGLRESFYVSEQLDCDLTFRELVLNPDFPDYDTILKQFTRFTFELHQKGIEFMDHSPGNTLIKKSSDGNYDFSLVDLNRMKFHSQMMDFTTRMKNLCRLTHREDMVADISKEYAQLSGEDFHRIFSVLWGYTQAFQNHFNKKRRLKKKLKFWKK
jgi:hypothetical protein